MKVLYAIQGTGNGHVSRAREIGPVLEKHCEVDYLLSGMQVELELQGKLTYRTHGLSLYFGKNGGIDLPRTYSRNQAGRVLREIRELPVEKYDLVINDFEPTSAWAARKKGIPCIGLSHQCALQSPKSPRPKQKDPLGMAVLKHYAPVSRSYGFHFRSFDENIYTPVIRSDIRKASPFNAGHYTVYLPAYNDSKIISVLSLFPDVQWEVFSKHCTSAYISGNIKISPVHDRKFAASMLGCAGVLCGAGFETPSEALYLGKKLMVIPMKNQYEQQCNAEALRHMTVPVLKSLKKKRKESIREWVDSPMPDRTNYPDQTEAILTAIFNGFRHGW